MIRTKRRLRLCVTLLILNLVFIWGNSLLPGWVSRAFSNWVKDLLFLIPNTSSGSAGGGLLRKLAHFTEFAMLGACLRWLFGMLGQKPWEHLAFPFSAGLLAACIDETIQIFVPDRGPALKDVGIDTLGIVLGIVLTSLINLYTKSKYLEENKL